MTLVHRKRVIAETDGVKRDGFSLSVDTRIENVVGEGFCFPTYLKPPLPFHVTGLDCGKRLMYDHQQGF